ncbi:outer surface lipoprotein OspB [Borreliella burgdorferi]|uniref:Outer surface protein B n=1 Tax=Borreliella burgdorferi TaxID=139 RepID=Q6RH17_BORBG|nr:outer surface lipoprotein OspB [Borreliella burgdorferi]AAA22952.1 OspB [Borreliella burgdorferi]AAR89543.1 outer surface protein B [Borreliella burgdorferi]AAR89544.1 outer surface protein B [Borreliella burgdorferi]ACL33763.1 outer surface protein B (OspB) [Borreliella burgdorferi 156a]ACN55248.1 outer surface protein B [Borreliella burgdorferi WI91-23]
MRLLIGFALALALIGCAQKGAESIGSQKENDLNLEDSSKKSHQNAKQDLPAVTEDSVSLFNGNKIFVSKEKNSSGKYDLRATIDQVELKGTSDKNNGSGTLEGSKPDKSKVKLTVSADLNTVTLETFNASNQKISSKVTKKQGSITEETLKANKLDSKKLTRSNGTTLEYSQITDADNATKAVETLKNSIKLEGSLVGGKTTVEIKEGTVTLKREIEKDGKVKVFLNDTAGSNKKTGKWEDSTSTLTISADSTKTKDLVFLTDGTITVQQYNTAGTSLEGSASEIKNLSELKNALK